MRSDARKRMQRRKPAPIGIAQRPEGGDWDAACNGLCARPLLVTTDNWPDIYEVAFGHACLYHRDPR